MSNPDNLFITGSGGVGKSALLKHMLKNALGYKNVEVTAYTGVAALPINGTTLHSFPGIKPGDYTPEDYLWQARGSKHAKRRIRAAETLIIDEISMVTAQLLNVADYIMKSIREDPRPFGGCQIILLGDFLQLPPPEKKYTLCYDAKAWRQAKMHIYALTEIFRQKDAELIENLNKVRMGEVDTDVTLFFQQFVRKPHLNSPVTELYALNRDVDRRNMEELMRLPATERIYVAEDEGNPWAVQFLQRNCIAPTELTLKVGAKVMLLKNRPEDCLVNGSLGIVVATDPDQVVVNFKTGTRSKDVKLKQEDWTYIARGRSEAKRSQIPLKLAYAQTIHKSQGQTLSAAYIDMKEIFADGHGYTGLSRVAGTEGLYLSGFNKFMIKTDERTMELYKLITKMEPGFCLADTSGSVGLSEEYSHPEREEENE